jgi:hypothetical protein
MRVEWALIRGDFLGMAVSRYSRESSFCGKVAHTASQKRRSNTACCIRRQLPMLPTHRAMRQWTPFVGQWKQIGRYISQVWPWQKECSLYIPLLIRTPDNTLDWG